MVEVRDFVVWVKHIHGIQPLKKELDALAEGELIKLSVDGKVGVWEKMANGKDGRPTPGIKPLGDARTEWHALYRSRAKDLVTIEAA